MFVWVGKEADGVIVIGRVVSASCDLLAELLCIGRFCRSYDSDRFCHINTVLLIVNE